MKLEELLLRQHFWGVFGYKVELLYFLEKDSLHPIRITKDIFWYQDFSSQYLVLWANFFLVSWVELDDSVQCARTEKNRLESVASENAVSKKAKPSTGKLEPDPDDSLDSMDYDMTKMLSAAGQQGYSELDEGDTSTAIVVIAEGQLTADESVIKDVDEIEVMRSFCKGQSCCWVKASWSTYFLSAIYHVCGYLPC
jgi:hypothetical protein